VTPDLESFAPFDPVPPWRLRGKGMHNNFVSEMVGTAMLILFGDGVVAAVNLHRSKAENGGWIVITTGWAVAVMVGALAATYSGGLINPALTIGFAVAGDLDWADVPALLGGEFVGAFIGAVLVYLAYLPHWQPTEDAGLKLAVFSTGPAIRNLGANLLTEIIGTFALVFGVYAIDTHGGTPRALALGRSRADPGRVPRVGHRPVARWADRLRDQPRARSEPAHRPRPLADPREGDLRLAVQLGAGRRTDHRRDPRSGGRLGRVHEPVGGWSTLDAKVNVSGAATVRVVMSFGRPVEDTLMSLPSGRRAASAATAWR
jgi:glycerol uptake facilitator-like aquaporin